MKTRTIEILLILTLLSGCVANNVVTQEEIETQSRADAVVSRVLFENDLDESTSYNIRKNGLVVIKFDKSVSRRTYTKVVNALRSSQDISGVQAEQSGREVCPLR